MAPKVCVPADFGRHHIGAPSHGNLTFNLGEGVQIKANSIILSLNSPIIDDLTTNLHLTSLEAEDFTREAVDCFIEASYTGEIEAVTVGNFRDVNKMSRVFDVSWLVARCEKYFVSYLDKLDSESSYPDILFAVEEAVYLLSTVKKRDFLELVVKKIITISAATRDSFIKQYLSDFANSSCFKIDACIAIVKTDVHVLVEVLIFHIEQNGNKSLDQSSRYLLRNIDMTFCFNKKSEVHAKLFSVLEDLTDTTTDDFKLFVFLHKQNTSKQIEMVKCLVPVLKLGSFNKYLSMEQYFEEVFDLLAAREDISNLYSFIDGLWCRLDNIRCYQLPSNILQKIINIKEQRGWGKVNRNYVVNLETDSHTSDFMDMVTKCDQLVCGDKGDSSTPIFEYSCEDFVKEIFCKNKITFKFRIPGQMYTDQEFVLYFTAMKGDEPDSFDMQWGLLDDTTDSHVNSLPDLHFALERWKDNKWNILPLIWCGKPTCDETKTFCNWGYIKFHDEDLSTVEMLVGEDGGTSWQYYKDNKDGKLRLVFFVVK